MPTFSKPGAVSSVICYFDWLQLDKGDLEERFRYQVQVEYGVEDRVTSSWDSMQQEVRCHQ